ncbi:Abi family protein [Stenoxybacter acetivorans]|uniref:Abi family protein n=1 Tax=Stenoxybacter acetivorans TaxID=422441 RepID=UPI000561B49F|nr:Abi family protein [Stenoxybacter acetivorans]
MDTELKSWKSFDEQLALLESLSLLVGNRAKALDYLQRIGYYRLSGYWYPFRQFAADSTPEHPKRSHVFFSGNRFEDVVNLYVFDKKLRLLALDALERIEMAVRVDIAHLLGEKCPNAHEKPEYLHKNFTRKQGNNPSRYEKWFSKHQDLIKRSEKQPFIKHHQEKYGGSLPIWVACEIWDFGTMSKLFSGMQHLDQIRIAKKYGLTEVKHLKKWLESLNSIRNIAAHHGRLWNTEISPPVNFSENFPEDAQWRSLGEKQNHCFPYFCMMQKMLNIICPNSAWGSRLVTLIKDEFPKVANNTIGLKDMGIPDNLLDHWSCMFTSNTP